MVRLRVLRVRRGGSRAYRWRIQEHDMGLARQGKQRRDSGGEGVAEGRCKLTLVERSLVQQHVVGSNHDQHLRVRLRLKVRVRLRVRLRVRVREG